MRETNYECNDCGHEWDEDYHLTVNECDNYHSGYN